MGSLTHCDLEFQRLTKAFLAAHPEVRHEWRDVHHWHGNRIDLVCGVGLPTEVFASIGGQLVVGLTKGEHRDFEDFGRDISDEELAREAFAHLVDLLRQHGHLDVSNRDDG